MCMWTTVVALSTLTVAPISFRTPTGEKNSIYSIRITNVNTTELIPVTSNVPLKWCQYTCVDGTSAQLQPIEDVLSVYVTIPDTYLHIQVRLHGKYYSIHPTSMLLSKLSKEVEDSALKQDLNQYLYHQNHFEPYHLIKRDAHTQVNPSLIHKDHDVTTHHSTLFRVANNTHHLIEQAFMGTIRLIETLGMSFRKLIERVLLMVHMDPYKNIFQLFQYYVHGSFQAIHDHLPIINRKFQNWVHKVAKDNVTVRDEMPEQFTDNQMREESPVSHFLQDQLQLSLHHNPVALDMSDLKEVVSPLLHMNVTTSGTKAGSLQGVLDAFQLTGLYAFGNVSSSTMPIAPSFHGKMLSVMQTPLIPTPFTESLLFFLDGFEFTILNILMLIGSVYSGMSYMAQYNRMPVTSQDVVSIVNAPSFLQLPNAWLYDTRSGPPNAMKEYRIRCILDWFPKHWITSMVSTVLFEQMRFGSNLVTNTMYIFHTFLIIPIAYPVEWITENSIQAKKSAMEMVYTPVYVMWYLWVLTCMLHLTRPMAVATGRMHWLDTAKGLLMGVPQLVCVAFIVNDLRQQVQFNKPVEATHFMLNSLSWNLDAMTMVHPLMHVPNPWGSLLGDTYLFGMIGMYTARNLWMQGNGIPSVMLRYSSDFQDIPSDIQQWVK